VAGSIPAGVSGIFH